MTQDADRIKLHWDEGGKIAEMERWSKRVLADDRVGKGECAVAWALTYAFNGRNGRCWQTNATIAEAARLSPGRVAEMLRNLDEFGHIVRKIENVDGRQMRVIRPTITKQFDKFEPRKRRGGIRKADPDSAVEAVPPPTDGQYPTPTDGQCLYPTDRQSPCIQDESEIDPRINVAGVVTGSVPPPPDDDWWEDDTIPIP